MLLNGSETKISRVDLQVSNLWTIFEFYLVDIHGALAGRGFAIESRNSFKG
jgi:hypothetical protein